MDIAELENRLLKRVKSLPDHYTRTAEGLRIVGTAVLNDAFDTLHPDADLVFGEAVELLKVAAYREQQLQAQIDALKERIPDEETLLGCLDALHLIMTYSRETYIGHRVYKVEVAISPAEWQRYVDLCAKISDLYNARFMGKL